jgi:hypothetical protein
MTAKQKIEEAERWLVKIKNAYPYNPLEIQDNVNAFLGTTNSIPDHLLEDYNIKFGLRISPNVKNFRREFQNKVMVSIDTTLLNFYLWFKVKRKFIEERDKLGSILSNKRHLNTHRTIQAPDGSIIFDEISTTKNYGFVQEYFAEMLKTGKKPENVKLPEGVNNIQVMWYFDDLPKIYDFSNIDIVKACEQLLDMMKDFISKTHAQFP